MKSKNEESITIVKGHKSDQLAIYKKVEGALKNIPHEIIKKDPTNKIKLKLAQFKNRSPLFDILKRQY